MANNEEDKITTKEKEILYNDMINAIRYSKRQQWNSIYLTMLSLAGIISLHLSVGKEIPCKCFDYLLLIICVIVGVLGIIFISRYYCDIKRYRSIKEEVVKQFTNEFGALLKMGSSKTHHNNDLSFFVFSFSVLIGLAMCVVLIIILTY